MAGVIAQIRAMIKRYEAWHKDTDIEHTAGVEESLIHSWMFAEVGLPILMGLFWEINAGVLR